MTVPDLETLFTSVDAFDVPASPLQRAICRVVDGRPLGDLAQHGDVIAAMGGADAVAALPACAPAEFYLLSGIRGGKSRLAACLALRASQSVDLTSLAPGEVPRVSILSLKLDVAQVTLAHLVGTLQAKPALGRLMIGEPTSDSVMLRHPSGRPIEVKMVAGSRAAGSIVARWSAGLIADEFPRMLGAEEGVVNFDDARTAVLGRLLPGAQLIGIGSPWATFGPAYDLVQERWGKPSADCVVVRGSGPAMNGSWWTPQRCADLQRRDERAYRCDVLGEFVAATTAAFPTEAVEAAFRAAPQGDMFRPVLVLDPSSGKADSFVAAIVGYVAPAVTPDDYLEVEDRDAAGNVYCRRIAVDDWGNPVIDPARLALLRPTLVVHAIWAIEGAWFGSISLDTIIRDLADAARSWSATHAYGDQHLAPAIHAGMRRHGITYEPIAITASNKPTAVEHLKHLLSDRAITFPESEALRSELLTYSAKLQANGAVRYEARGASLHDDFVAVLVTACAVDAVLRKLPGSPVQHANGRNPASWDARSPTTTD